MIEQIFTFGYGQQCPYTGKNLADHYATIIAPDTETARKIMLAVFGRTWAFQYDSPEAAGVERFHMVEHAHIDLTAGASAILARLRALAVTYAALPPGTELRDLGHEMLAILDGEGGAL